jgi:DNA-binding response OmpR family regulator
MLTELLRRGGFEPQSATTIALAISEAERRHVDAVILDVNLAEVGSGIDLLAWFRGQPQYHSTPILILTGLRSLPEDEESLIRRHGAYVFYKPESIPELVTYLKRLV